MDSTIINMFTNKEQQANLNPEPNSGMSPELIYEIQILIQRLRESNPIKKTG